MRTIKQYIEAAKARKENGEAGFSLVELIVVVVILGILAAVAIPIFGSIQDKAETNALKAAVGTIASQATANIAAGEAPGITDGDTIEGIKYNIVFDAGKATSVCITGTKAGVTGSPHEAGPGC